MLYEITEEGHKAWWEWGMIMKGFVLGPWLVHHDTDSEKKLLILSAMSSPTKQSTKRFY